MLSINYYEFILLDVSHKKIDVINLLNNFFFSKDANIHTIP